MRGGEPKSGARGEGDPDGAGILKKGGLQESTTALAASPCAPLPGLRYGFKDEVGATAEQRYEGLET